jgi:hypothetical protein
MRYVDWFEFDDIKQSLIQVWAGNSRDEMILYTRPETLGTQIDTEAFS